MQRSKHQHSIGYSTPIFNLLTMHIKLYFLNTNFKQPDAFLVYIKFSISYRGPKLWKKYLHFLNEE